MTETLHIIDIAMRTGISRSLTRLLEGSSLEQELSREGTYTLFAPADISFAYLPPQTINQLLDAANQGILADVLGYHAVPEKLLVTDLGNLSRLKTAYGEDLTVTNIGGLRIDGARLLQSDIQARNGVIHVIDRLLLPAGRGLPPPLKLTHFNRLNV